MPNGTEHVGDPEFQERHFVDTSPWTPPVWEPGHDPYFKPARTYADVSIEEAGGPAGVVTPGLEPGPSEFSHGRGLMVPLELGPGPTQVEEMKAIMRTDSTDPAATHLGRYADWIRE